MAEERALFNANDGLTGRDGGPYLDQQEQITAEIRRAKIEGREPDLDNPPASAGVVLLNAGQVLANRGINNLPSQEANDFLSADKVVRGVAEQDDNNLKVASVVAPDGIDESAKVDTSMRTALAGDARDEVDESDKSGESDESDESVNDEPLADSETENVLGDTTGESSANNV